MSTYARIKQTVTTRQAAERYGLSVNRSGMARCPFHADHNPSMKVDDRFYNLETSNKITNKSGKKVNGFWGIQALTAPIIL